MSEWANRAGKPPEGGTPAIRGAGYRAFSLIELLVVIAIIGILAGILLAVMPGVMHRKTMATVQTELTQLQAAIEYYKEKNGFYPPDNQTTPTNIAITRPPLFYELVGTRAETTAGNTFYYPLNGETNLSSGQITNVFGLGGFLNSGEAAEVKNFYPTLKSRQYQRDTNNNNIIYLVAPAKGPGGQFNPWRYVVAKPNPTANQPRNNPGSYDLWAEVIYGGRTNVVGNWKK